MISFVLGRVEEAADLFAGGFVGVGGASGEFVGGAMDVGIFVGVEVAEAVDDALWFLRRRGVVEPDEGLAVDALLEDGEVAADGGGVERFGGKIGDRGVRSKQSSVIGWTESRWMAPRRVGGFR